MEGAESTQSMEGVETDYRLSHELVGHEADVRANLHQQILGNTLGHNFTIPNHRCDLSVFYTAAER